jgi:PST family polysaccharide transporter
MFTDYGFNLTATREISIAREDRGELNRIVSRVFTIKMIFVALTFFCLIGICLLFTKFKQDMLLYIIIFGIVLGNAFFPTWFFQGIERMKFIAVLNIISKSIFTVLIFVLVKVQSDYLWVVGLNSISQLIVSLVALYIIFKDYRITFQLPSKSEIIGELKDGWHVFIGLIASSLYTTTNTFILGILTNNTIVGYYSAGERIVKAAQWMLSPLWQTIYPHISRLVIESKEAALHFIRQITVLVVIFTFSVSCLLLFFAPQISAVILGRQFKESIIVIQILSFLPFICSLGNIFGTQIMLNFGLKKIYARIIIIGSVINIFLAITLVLFFQHIGISLSMLLTETIITILNLTYLYLNGINIVQLKFSKKIN